MNGNDGIGRKGGVVPPPPPLPKSPEQESSSSSTRVKSVDAKRYVGKGVKSHTLADEVFQKAKSIAERQISESDSGIGSSVTDNVANLSDLEPEIGLQYKAVFESLEELSKNLPTEKVLYIRESIKSFKEIEKNKQSIHETLTNADLSNGEKCKFFKSQSNGVLVHIGESPVPLILRACDNLPQYLFSLLSDPETDNLEVFDKFFDDGAICLEARYSIAQQYILDRMRPKSSANPYDDIIIKSTDSVNDILYEHLRVFSQANPEDLSGLKDFLYHSPKLNNGLRAVDGEVNRESIDNFLENELGLVD